METEWVRLPVWAFIGNRSLAVTALSRALRETKRLRSATARERFAMLFSSLFQPAAGLSTGR